jgi:hypothetical protein
MEQDPISTDEVIESLVRIHGGQDSRSQHLYRQSLQTLVGLAKIEQRREIDCEIATTRINYRGAVH